MRNWIIKIKSPFKLEMIMKFTDKFHIEEDYLNCRNKTCQKPLKKRDGSAICSICCVYYRRTRKIRAIGESKQKIKKSNSKSFYMKFPICHDPICNKLLTKNKKGNFCQSCFSLKKRKKRKKAITKERKIFSKFKIEMLAKFNDILDLGDCNLNCRNQYCRKLLERGKDGPAICCDCCRYYRISKGKLRGKDKPIRKRKLIPSKRMKRSSNKK